MTSGPHAVPLVLHEDRGPSNTGRLHHPEPEGGWGTAGGSVLYKVTHTLLS